MKLSSDELKEAFNLLLNREFVLSKDRSGIDCKVVYCGLCPLYLVDGCEPNINNFVNYLKENYEELIV